MINRITEGPKVFLYRLISGGYLGPVILNPTKSSFHFSKKNRNKYICRLDGVYLYSFNINALKTYLKSRNKNIFIRSFLVLAYILFRKKSNKFLNVFLSRYCFHVTRNTNYIVFQSRLSREMHLFLFGKNFLDGKKVQIIHNGIAFEDLNLSGYNPNDIFEIVISASTYRPHKRLIAAINLVNKLAKIGRFRLTILGLIPSYLVLEIAKLDLSKCNFIGQVDSICLKHHMIKCHLQISLSLFDPCPNVVLDGLSVGLIILSPLQSGAAELLNFRNDFVVDENKELGFVDSFDLLNLDFPYDKYIDKICKIKENYNQLQLECYLDAKCRLNIDNVVRFYTKFGKEVYHEL